MNNSASDTEFTKERKIFSNIIELDYHFNTVQKIEK